MRGIVYHMAMNVVGQLPPYAPADRPVGCVATENSWPDFHCSQGIYTLNIKVMSLISLP